MRTANARTASGSTGSSSFNVSTGLDSRGRLSTRPFIPASITFVVLSRHAEINFSLGVGSAIGTCFAAEFDFKLELYMYKLQFGLGVIIELELKLVLKFEFEFGI